jgi:hypothetical protein
MVSKSSNPPFTMIFRASTDGIGRVEDAAVELEVGEGEKSWLLVVAFKKRGVGVGSEGAASVEFASIDGLGVGLPDTVVLAKGGPGAGTVELATEGLAVSVVLFVVPSVLANGGPVLIGAEEFANGAVEKGGRAILVFIGISGTFSVLVGKDAFA